MSYDIKLDDKYGQMNMVDIPAETAALLLDFEDRETVTLEPHQGYTVPTGD